MRRPFWLIAVALLTVPVYAQTEQAREVPPPDGPDFREITWGMTPDEVKAVEGTPNSEDENELAYAGEVVGTSATLAYHFYEDEAVQAVYTFSRDHTDEASHLEAYQDLKALLQEAYGDPASDQVLWLNARYQNQPEQYGLAIRLGHLKLETERTTSRTHIRHTLRGENTAISHELVFTSRAHEHIAEMPELIGGLADLVRNIRYPDTARRMGVEGRVIVQFVVDEDGQVTDAFVARGIGAGCDEEALRVVRGASFRPGTRWGKPARVKMSLPITFKMRR